MRKGAAAEIVSTLVFLGAMWVFQGSLNNVTDIAEAACDMKRCAEAVAQAHWLGTDANLTVSFVAGWVAWKFGFK